MATSSITSGSTAFITIPDTPADVINILEQARSSQRRIRLYYGDPNSGRDWLEEYDVEGRINISIGPLKVPLLIENRYGIGGSALLDHCIVKIKAAGKNAVLHQHPRYHAGTFTIRAIGFDETCGDTNLRQKGYTHAVDVNGSNHANFRSLGAAKRFIHTMTG